MNHQQRIEKLYTDLRIEENEMLKDKPEIKEKVKQLVAEYEDMFVMLGRMVGTDPDQYETHIRLKPGAKPKKQKLQQLHPQQLQDLQVQLDDWLQEGVI